MTIWFWRGLRDGVVTTRYPAAPERSIEALPSPPVFRGDLLTPELVEKLVDVCPSRALRREGDLFVYDVGACTGCGRCLATAGDAARRSGHIELATRSRDHLIKRFPISLPEAR